MAKSASLKRTFIVKPASCESIERAPVIVVMKYC